MAPGRWALLLLVFLLANSAYLASTAEASLFYMTNVLLHVIAGLGVAAVGIVLVARRWRSGWRLAWLWPVVAIVSGSALLVTGATRPFRPLLWFHIGTSFVAAWWVLKRLEERFAPGQFWRTGILAGRLLLGLALIAPLASWMIQLGDSARLSIRNPVLPPLSMEEEGAGKGSPFWPSSIRTPGNQYLPGDFFLSSERCGECHRDIYEQWKSSAHRFASFNNQFYRRSIEHMQELAGVEPSKWCAGCHDHALLLSGQFERPVRELLHLPEAHAGLGCVSCHSITLVHSTMGNADFTITYPALHRLAASNHPLLRALDNFLTRIDPEPHRRTFLKPFMRDSAEFCSACHKVHLDQPVNHYRWLRGFNDYDNWQASGVSGQGARSFYYPAEPKTCAGCHMPLVPSNDPGNRNGKVHSHRFAAANSALAYVYEDQEQFREVQRFLEQAVTVDIFAASPALPAAGLSMLRRAEELPRLSTTFATGEEAEFTAPVYLREVEQVAAPVEKAAPFARAGDTIRLDVVVRTRNVGHFFPAGTVDAFDVWLEVKAVDAGGRVIFWSGRVEQDGRGPVDPGAHFYRSFLLDGAGNPINKRNAWQARSVLYVQLIPPGAADVAHYRMEIPRDARGPIRVTAALHYRKFSHYYTRFAYAGKPTEVANGNNASLDHDSRAYVFDEAFIPSDVGGKIRDRIPDLPILTLAADEVVLPLLPPGSTSQWRQVLEREDRDRWNDWGIGLLLQGDLKGAEYAFRKVTEIDPLYADGWLNVARALIREGEIERARPYLQKALELGPELGRVHFFLGMVQKAEGHYEGALASLERVARQYPRDRVVWNEIGRLRFLKRDYAGAVQALRRVLEIDPEDVRAHYTLMLAYRGLGDSTRALLHSRLFQRFKADETAQRVTLDIRRLNPEANNERQPIHEHTSVPLD